MITNTFAFLEGIARKTELQLWQSGITDWNKFLDKQRIFNISTKSKIYYDYELKNAKKALLENDASYFAQIPHIDLRHLCAEVGLTGGLKKIEKELNIKRENFLVERIHGGDAAQLWRLWQGSRDEYYLRLLIEYNEEDIVNLKRIMEHCYKEIKSQLLEKLKYFDN